MQFIHQGLAWGFLLTLLPLLIHLINLLRHRRVKWAAMDFLLQSYKKHRKWIWLRQMALLTARMTAIALAVAMLAQWVTRDQWFALFGGNETHHYVLLDDSLSMTERQGGASAFEQALQAVSHIGSRAMLQETRQRFTLLRLSRASSGFPGTSGPSTTRPTTNNSSPDPKNASASSTVAADDSSANADRTTPDGPIADMNAEPVGSSFDLALQDVIRSIVPSQLALSPLSGIDFIKRLASQRTDENRIIYIVSDYRDSDWRDLAGIRESLKELSTSGTEVRLVSCVQSEKANLGITRLAPAEDTQVAGVPLFVNVTVKNFSKDTVRKVTVKIRSHFFDPDAISSGTPGQLPGVIDEPPSILIDELAAGESMVRRVQVFFPKPGEHVVEAILPDDPIAADNRRWAIVKMDANEPVLFVDGDPDQRHSYFLGSVFQPGQRAVTGILPETKSPSFLRDTRPELLSRFKAIYLLDVDNLDAVAVNNVENFVSQGGGLAIFVGERVNVARYNERLYRAGEGFFPVPLERDDYLAPNPNEETPDIEVTNHPIFLPFLGERNPLIGLVSVERFLRPPRDWTPSPGSKMSIIAKLRNRFPLVCERPFGEGRVVAFLTTAAPLWNNWGNDPSFVVALLKLQSYLSATSKAFEDSLVGTPISVQLDSDKFRDNVTFVAPGQDGIPTGATERIARPPRADSAVKLAQFGVVAPSLESAGETERSGIYEAWTTATAGTAGIRRFALNVDPHESQTALADSAQLLADLLPVKAKFNKAEELPYETVAQAGHNHSLQILWILIALLVGEQLLAFYSSYHPAKGAVR